ncbi:MAG: phosphotransferase family protein [Acidimicrobiales bacterium]
MQASDLQRAVAAAKLTVSACDLAVDDAIVLRDANRVVLRLLPCDVVVRIAPLALRASAELEVELVDRLVGTKSPVVPLEPRVEPRVYVGDGFVMNMWTYCEPAPPGRIPPVSYADALTRLHAGLRQVDLTTPRFTDRVTEAQRVVGSHEDSPMLADADREVLSGTLQGLKGAISDRGAAEQLLHGEPHPGNLLGTASEPLFIDLETCCRGPVEFDIAHAPEDVSEHYADADQALVDKCRGLILAMVAAWRWQRGDRDPGGRRAGLEILSALRQGPPWPALDVISQRLAAP